MSAKTNIQAASAVTKAADRANDLARYGSKYRSGGRRVWTAKNGRAVADKRACRKGEF